MKTLPFYILPVYLLFSLVAFGQKTTYIKLSDRYTKTPLDSFDVGLYREDKGYIEFISNAISDSQGLVAFKTDSTTHYKISANQMREHVGYLYWPVVEKMYNYHPDTFAILADKTLDVFSSRFKYENVYFAFGSDSLIDFYKEKIDTMLSGLDDMFKADSNRYLLVKGYSDTKENSTFKNDISLSRAENVRAYLISKGVNKNKIQSYRSSVPMVSETKDGLDNPEGRAINRRVEFKIWQAKPTDYPDIEYESSK